MTLWSELYILHGLPTRTRSSWGLSLRGTLLTPHTRKHEKGPSTTEPMTVQVCFPDSQWPNPHTTCCMWSGVECPLYKDVTCDTAAMQWLTADWSHVDTPVVTWGVASLTKYLRAINITWCLLHRKIAKCKVLHWGIGILLSTEGHNNYHSEILSAYPW